MSRVEDTYLLLEIVTQDAIDHLPRTRSPRARLMIGGGVKRDEGQQSLKLLVVRDSPRPLDPPHPCSFRAATHARAITSRQFDSLILLFLFLLILILIFD
jgi:hypothetical protein